jgi:hypothetical protein
MNTPRIRTYPPRIDVLGLETQLWICIRCPVTDPEKKLGKSLFLTINFCLSLVLIIELQTRTPLTIQLLKPFTIDHQAVLMGGFNFFLFTI